MRKIFLAISFVFVSVAMLSPAQAERRMALVLGNSDYLVGPLDNPKNDAELIASTLEEAGFEVTKATDLDYRSMQRAVVMFGRQLADAGKDTVGMVYYAGHAVQANGENYLIPIDATLQDELDLEIQTLQMSTLMKSLERAGNRLNMVVLDACRNNPFKSISRSGTRGLAKVDAPQGTLLAYSTSPGNVALDGSGRNSPYTEALARAIQAPGVPVEHVFKNVRIDVMATTSQQQVPWESSSLTGDFYFKEAAVVATPEPAAPAPQANPQQAEIAFWTSIANSSDPAMFQSYLQVYPNGLFAGIAEQRIASLQAQQAQSASQSRQAEARALWDSVKETTDVNVLNALVTRFPDTVFAELASARIQTLQAVAAREQALAEQRSLAAASATPAASEASSAEAERLFWQSIQNSTNKSDYEAYLAQYPNGTFASIAQDRAANGYAPQVAALTPGAHPYDGVWVIDMEMIGWPYASNDWCKAGEEGTAEMVVENGKGTASVESQFSSVARVTLEFDDEGSVTGKKYVNGWRSPRKLKFNVSSGSDEREFNAMDWCGERFTLRRK